MSTPPEQNVGRFHIVEFVDEGSTYVVPKNWVRGDAYDAICFWPPTTTKKEVDRMILSAVPVEDDWECYNARILATKSTYERAKECLPDALVTSHLDSEGSDVEKKRRRKRKAVLFSDSESDASEVPPSCSLKKKGLVGARGRQIPAAIFKPRASYNIHAKHLPAVPRHVERPAKHGTDLQAKASTSWAQDSDLSDCEVAVSSAPANTSLLKETSSLPPWFTAFEKKVFDNQMKILVELKSMRTLLTANKSTRVLVLPEDCPTLPASTVADVQAIEEYLSSQEHMELLTNYCSRFGGTDFQDTVRILLRNLMTKAASLQFSWKGSRGRKNAFAELKNINNMILACLRAHYPEQASLTKCSAVVKRWLIGAQDREGGRNKRRQSSQAGVANTLLEE